MCRDCECLNRLNEKSRLVDAMAEQLRNSALWHPGFYCCPVDGCTEWRSRLAEIELHLRKTHGVVLVL